jgi:signal transduction histidine kinase
MLSPLRAVATPEVMRLRARIAADLHDEVGAGLSRLAVLSEVVKRQIRDAPDTSARLLDDMAETARGMVDAMSDIVWAIDPQRDDLVSLIARVRQFASAVFDAQGIRWNLQMACDPAQVRLDPDQRRHTYLILKESIHNVLRHAHCRSVSIVLSVIKDTLRIDIRDDGRGFTWPPAATIAPSGGHGLMNLHVRASDLGGHCTIRTAPGAGTRVIVEYPIG